MTTPGASHQIGSLAEEAGQLIDAVAARLTRLRTATATAGESATGESATGESEAGESEAVAGSAHTCLDWCPICRGADLLRGDRPDMSEKLVDSALVVLTALRSLIRDQPPAADDSHTTDPIDRAGVERIDIR